jgi:hypothetical protein
MWLASWGMASKSLSAVAWCFRQLQNRAVTGVAVSRNAMIFLIVVSFYHAKLIKKRMENKKNAIFFVVRLNFCYFHASNKQLQHKETQMFNFKMQ